MNVLCWLAWNDIVGAKNALKSHSIEDASFDGSQELILCSELIRCIEENNGNREELTALIAGYNNVHPANRARNSLMVKIQDVHCPPEEHVNDPIGQFAKKDELDFTGANEEEKKGDGVATADELNFM